MHARECVHCAAPLPDAPAEARVTCPYCGTVNEATVAVRVPEALRAPAPSAEASAEDRREALKEALKEELHERLDQAFAHRHDPPPESPAPLPGRRRGRGCGCGFCLLPVIIGVLVFNALRRQLPQASGGNVIQQMAHSLGLKVKPADLAGLQDHQWVDLDVAQPLAWYALDPAAKLPWARSLALQWAPDARLSEVEVQRLGPDGYLALNRDSLANVIYTFESRDKVRQSLQERARQTGDIQHGLRIRLSHAGIAAQPLYGFAPDLPPPEVPALQAMPLLMGTVLQAQRLPEQPAYNAALRPRPNGDWAWTLTPIASRGSATIRASDGKLYK